MILVKLFGMVLASKKLEKSLIWQKGLGKYSLLS